MQKTKLILKKYEKILAREKSERIRREKFLIAEFVLTLRRKHKKKFGLFVIFGWNNRWNHRYLDISDPSQDIFARRKMDILHGRDIDKIDRTLDFDGAILIDSSGTILHSGIVIEGLRPRLLAERLAPAARHLDLSARLGFKTKVHTRHLSAIAASWELKGTTVFTVSEETGDVHVFERGRIVFFSPLL